MLATVSGGCCRLHYVRCHFDKLHIATNFCSGFVDLVKVLPAGGREGRGKDREAAGGGVLGYTFATVIRKGMARGVFSNEAGLGSAPIAAAAAKTKEPVRQGLVTMTGTFIDTICICTLTGLAIVISGAWADPSLEGVEITSAAFRYGLPLPERVSEFILMLCLVFFAFTTIIGWSYYSERCLAYLCGGARMTSAFRILYIVTISIAPYLSAEAVWGIADIFNGLMALPNITALIVLSGEISSGTAGYFSKRRIKAE